MMLEKRVKSTRFISSPVIGILQVENCLLQICCLRIRLIGSVFDLAFRGISHFLKEELSLEMQSVSYSYQFPSYFFCLVQENVEVDLSKITTVLKHISKSF